MSTTELVNDDEGEKETFVINYGFVLNQLQRAALNKNKNKIDKWEAVIKNWNTITVGSKTPVAGTPEWVTLEVAHGGFATGNFMAGGELQEHEKALYEYFFNEQTTDVETCRLRLNLEFLTPRGIDCLTSFLISQQYTIRVPEEGALLVVAWLGSRGYAEDAANIVDAIRPWFQRLRFYPEPAAQPRTQGKVSVSSVNEVKTGLEAIKTPKQLSMYKSIVDSLLPACDRFVHACALSCLNLEDLPSISVNEEGKRKTVGDMPFQDIDPTVKNRIQECVAELNGFPNDLKQTQRFRKGNIGRLKKYAEKYLKNYNGLSDLDRGFSRKLIAEINQSKGLLGSQNLKELRERQNKCVAHIGSFDDFAKVLIQRLSPYSALAGIENIEDILVPIKKSEQKGLLKEGDKIPETMKDKVTKAKIAPLDMLCQEGLIPSAEVLAVLCPSLVAETAASQTDKETGVLLGGIYQAFKCRRSLLLLNLESQVSIDDLPWMAALMKRKINIGGYESHKAAYRTTLEDVACLAITYWPSTLLPNKFVGVLEDLSNEVYSRGLPFMKEVAADIFMGQFSGTFLANAVLAAKQLEGSLYEKYYSIPYSKVKRFTSKTELEKLCGAKGTYSFGNVSENGVVIERCMVVTTHNLALIFENLNLKEKLASILPDLPKITFNAIVQETKGLRAMDWQTRLQHLKNGAYGWRQMVYYLSIQSDEVIGKFFEWVFPRMEKIKDDEYRTKLLRPLKHLHALYKGQEVTKEDKCVFKAWVLRGKTHFLMPVKKE